LSNNEVQNIPLINKENNFMFGTVMNHQKVSGVSLSQRKTIIGLRRHQPVGYS
jgi:hypothetical protein